MNPRAPRWIRTPQNSIRSTSTLVGQVRCWAGEGTHRAGGPEPLPGQRCSGRRWASRSRPSPTQRLWKFRWRQQRGCVCPAVNPDRHHTGDRCSFIYLFIYLFLIFFRCSFKYIVQWWDIPKADLLVFVFNWLFILFIHVKWAFRYMWGTYACLS